MKKICMILMCSGISVILQASENKIDELKKVVVGIQQSGMVPKVIADLKDLYSHVHPVIQEIQQKRAAKKSGTSTIPLTQSTSDKGDKGKDKDGSVMPATLQSSIKKTKKDLAGYSDDQVWDMVKVFNPVVYDFGQKNNMSLHDMVDFAHLLGQWDIQPTALVEFMKEHHDQSDAQHAHDYMVDHYTTMQQDDPSSYQTLILAMMHNLSLYQDDNKPTASPLSSAYVDVLHNKVSDQHSSIQYRNGGLCLTVPSFIGTLIWAIYYTYQFLSQGHAIPLNGTFTG